MNPARLPLRRLGVLGLVVSSVLTTQGCSSRQEQYCSLVEESQAELGEIAADPHRILEVLPYYEDLRSQAPDDIEAEWGVVISALEGLEDALDDAGLDATYDAANPPAGLPPEDAQAVANAASKLASTRTLSAMAAVEQHALDVCQTPLSR